MAEIYYFFHSLKILKNPCKSRLNLQNLEANLQILLILFKFAFPGKFLQTNRNVTDYDFWQTLPNCNLIFAILCNLFFCQFCRLIFLIFFGNISPCYFFNLFFGYYLQLIFCQSCRLIFLIFLEIFFPDIFATYFFAILWNLFFANNDLFFLIFL